MLYSFFLERERGRERVLLVINVHHKMSYLNWYTSSSYLKLYNSFWTQSKSTNLWIHHSNYYTEVDIENLQLAYTVGLMGGLQGSHPAHTAILPSRDCSLANRRTSCSTKNFPWMKKSLRYSDNIFMVVMMPQIPQKIEVRTIGCR